MKKMLFKFLLILSVGTLNESFCHENDKIHNNCISNRDTKENQILRIDIKEKERCAHSYFFKNNRSKFGLKEFDEMRYVSTFVNQKGEQHHRYQQYYRGIKVAGGTAILHERDNKVYSSTSSLVAINNLKLPKILSKDNAIAAGFNEMLAEHPSLSTTYCMKEPQTNHWELVIEMEKQQLNLFYKLAFDNKILEVDANSGELITIKNNHRGCDNGSVSTLFYGGQNITTHKWLTFPSNWELKDNCRGNGIETKREHASNKDFIRAKDPTNNYANDCNGNSCYTDNDKRAAATAHWSAEKTYDYFLNTFNRNSYDGVGGKITVIAAKGVVPAGGNADYGYHNLGRPISLGSVPERGSIAYYDPSNEHFHFGTGEGSNSTNHWVALDIVGHELTHALYNHTVLGGNANIQESSALEEAVCDIFGTMVEHYALGNQGNYLIGEEFRPTHLRDMKDPTQGLGGDIYYAGIDQNYYTGGSIINYWFYILAEGQSGTNDNGFSYNLQGIGKNQVANIVYRTITEETIRASRGNDDNAIKDFRDGTVAIAILEFGSCSPQLEELLEAWEAVGLPFTGNIARPNPGIDAPEAVCQGTDFSVYVQDDDPNYTHKWFLYEAGNPRGSAISTHNLGTTITATFSGEFIIEHELTTPCGVFIATETVVVNPEPAVVVLDKIYCTSQGNVKLSHYPDGGNMTISPSVGQALSANNGEWYLNVLTMNAGTYTLTYNYSNGNCSDKDQAIITIEEPPAVYILHFDERFCETEPAIDLQGAPSGGTWTGNGVVFSGGKWRFDPTVAGPGAHQITYTVYSAQGTCIAIAQQLFHVDDPITFAPSIPFPDACVGTSECFSANPTNKFSYQPSYYWDFTNSNNNPSPLPDPTHSTDPIKCIEFNAPGIHFIKLEGTNECGTTALTYEVEVKEPFQNFAVTTPIEICGTTNLQTNYTGPDFVSWDGNGVTHMGRVPNPSQDEVTRTVVATIENACGVSTDTTNITQYKKKNIRPRVFCTYGNATPLTADIADGNWVSNPNVSYPNTLSNSELTSQGVFNPSGVAPGEYRVTHQSICNKSGILKVLEGGPQGTETWPKQAVDLGYDESATGIVEATDGSYFIVGTFTGTMRVEPSEPILTSNGGTDIFLAKYDDCGIVWSTSFGSSSNDSKPSLAIDNGVTNEPIYVSATIGAGLTNLGSCATCNLNANSNQKGMLAKFDSDGNAIWGLIPANASGELNVFNDVDAFGGEVVIAGSFIGQVTNSNTSEMFFALGGGSDQDILATKISDNGTSAGNVLLAPYGSGNDDAGNGIAIDPNSQYAFVTGYATLLGIEAIYTPQNSGGKDIFVGALDLSFQWTWTHLYGGPFDDEGKGIDADNNIALTGYAKENVDLGQGFQLQTNNLSTDMFVLGLQFDGSTQWAQVGGSNLDLDQGNDIAISGTEATVIGEFSGSAFFGIGTITSSSNSDKDIFLSTYDVNLGTPTHLNQISGMFSNDQGHAIDASTTNQSYTIAGDFDGQINLASTLQAITGRDMFASRYSSASSFFRKRKEESLEKLEAKQIQLVKVYPNPTSDALKIELNLKTDQQIRLELMDVTGKKVSLVENWQAKEGESVKEINVGELPAGVYTLSILGDTFRESKKIVKSN